MTVNLNKRNLSILWSAQIISAAGDAVYQLALLWLVLDMTNSSTMTGLVAMSAYLPALIFGLYAGVMADKLNRLSIPLFPCYSRKNGWFVSMLCWQLPDNWLGCWVHFLLVCCSQFLLSQIFLLLTAHRLSLPFFYCSFSGDPSA